jgi:hypothetical protein
VLIVTDYYDCDYSLLCQPRVDIRAAPRGRQLRNRPQLTRLVLLRSAESNYRERTGTQT